MNKVQQIIDHFDCPTKWCKGAYGKLPGGVETVDFDAAHRMCLVGALSYLFPIPRELQAVKRFLEKFLEINAKQFLRNEIFHPGKGKVARLDYWSLAKFNDETDFPTLIRFLREAAQADVEAVMAVELNPAKLLQTAIAGS